MPTLEQNLHAWNNPDWSSFDNGEVWSVPFGGTDNLWQNMILPRVKPYLIKDNTALEIACGHGRITNILKDEFSVLHAVDVSSNCIEFCKERFAGSANIIYHLNDGYTLPVGSSSINFICSWDSLVHCEQDVINSYLAEIYRVLIPGGAAFLHFSNFGRYKGIKQNNHGRAESVTAETVFAQCNALGFNVKTLEKIKWLEDFENDAFITLCKE